MAHSPEYMHEYYLKNREEIRKKARAYREANKEQLAAKQKEWAANNPEKVAKKAARYRKRRRDDWWEDFKATLKCEKCGESRSYCLDFHHRDQNTKRFNIGQHTFSKTKEKVMDEVAKCMVLCANCHREVHYLMRNGEKDEQIPSL